MRTVYGFIGTVTSVYGFGVLPLVTVTALGFAMPLFLTIVSVPLLGERVGRAGPPRWSWAWSA